jgi:hypothetical protein
MDLAFVSGTCFRECGEVQGLPRHAGQRRATILQCRAGGAREEFCRKIDAKRLAFGACCRTLLLPPSAETALTDPRRGHLRFRVRVCLSLRKPCEPRRCLGPVSHSRFDACSLPVIGVHAITSNLIAFACRVPDGDATLIVVRDVFIHIFSHFCHPSVSQSRLSPISRVAF